MNPITTTSYSVTGTVNGCTTSTTGSVVVTPNPTVSVLSVSICSGQTASIIATGATSYTWDPIGVNFIGSTFTVSPISTTAYSVAGSTNGCLGSTTVSVNVGSNLSISANSPTICAGQTTTLQAVSTATNYSWSNGAVTNSTTVSPATNTSYTVNGNFVGCTGSAVVNVVVNANPAVINSNQTICSGQSATLTAVGATNYTWSTSSTATTIVVSPIINTTYSLVGANASCTASANYNVIVNNLPTITTNSANICNGSSATLTANGASTYTWLPLGTTSNTISVNPASNTSYTVIGSTGGCTNIATASVVVTTGGTVSVSGATVCNGQTAIIGTSAAATSYLWDNGATTQSITVSPNVNTTYSLQLVLGGCILTGSATVGITAAPIINVIGASICLGDNATIFASGATNYTWMPGNTIGNSLNVSPNITTNYVASSYSNGCTSSATAQVIVNTKPSLTVTPLNTMVCPNTAVTLSAIGANNYEWYVDGNYHFGNPVVITPSKTSVITVTGSNGGCNSTSITTVYVSTLNATFNSESNYVDYPGSLNFTNTSTGYTSILWDFGNGQQSGNNNPIAYYELPGKYLVTLLARDTMGCIDTTFYIIEAGCGNGDIYIPNTFTPNGDGLNDTFKVFGGTCLTAFSGTIFDRWGQQIFKFKDLSDAWDGKLKGIDIEIGTYNYLIKYTLYNGKQFEKTGVITLIR
jgi:gliding motility-associated-like protein